MSGSDPTEIIDHTVRSQTEATIILGQSNANKWWTVIVGFLVVVALICLLL